ncbi:MAG: hypothetical protein C0611_08900 [Desulfobacteraceae bacterium]|nr:MAG: hypothetical protein C0611_08900 [Desulfobacteraceae bacterium]
MLKNFNVFINQFLQICIVFLFNIKISVLCYQGKMLSKLGLCILLFVEGFSYALAGRVKVIYLINPFPDL